MTPFTFPDWCDTFFSSNLTFLTSKLIFCSSNFTFRTFNLTFLTFKLTFCSSNLTFLNSKLIFLTSDPSLFQLDITQSLFDITHPQLRSEKYQVGTVKCLALIGKYEKVIALPVFRRNAITVPQGNIRAHWFVYKTDPVVKIKRRNIRYSMARIGYRNQSWLWIILFSFLRLLVCLLKLTILDALLYLECFKKYLFCAFLRRLIIRPL